MKENIVRIFLFSFLIISSQSVVADINDKIIFGGDSASPPFEWQKDKSAIGFTIDLEDKLAQRGGAQSIHKLGTWTDMLEALANGEIDVLPMYISESRQAKYLLSSPFYFVEHAIYSSESHKNQVSIDNLSSHDVSVEAGYFAHENLIENHPNISIIPKNSTQTVLEAIEKGEVKYAVLAIPAAEYHIDKLKLNISRVSLPFWPRGYGFAVKNDRPELAAWIEENLNFILTSDIYGEVYDKWKSQLEPRQKNTKYNPKVILLVTSPLLILALLAYAWSWSLKRQVKAKTKEVLEQLKLTQVAESQIAQKEALFKTLVNSSTNAILIIDNDGAISFANKQTSHIFGWQNEDLIGKAFDDMISDGLTHYHSDMKPKMIEKDTEAFHSSEHQLIARTQDGQKLDVEVTLSPINIDSIPMTMAIVRDVTDKLKIESHLRQSQKMEAIGHLTGGVAHDFNNLLGVIIGNLDLLSSMYPDDNKAQKRIDGALKASLNGAELTKRLLTFARKQTLNPQLVDIGVCFEEMVPILDRTLEGKVMLDLNLSKSLSKVFVDNSEFENVILNMAINAHHAMPEGGVLTIDAFEVDLDDDFIKSNDDELSPGRYIHIVLSDTGSGMPPDVVKHIFEPFYTTKEKNKGTGLGLAMAHGFVKQSKGLIRVYSETDIGTSFHIYLPVAEGHEQQNHSSLVPEADLPEGDGEMILIVDDEMELAEIASDYLKSIGYNTLTVSSGEKALEVLAEDKEIALVLTDIIMPNGIDGVELHSCINERFPETKVVYASGFSGDALANKRKHEMTADLIQKPYRKHNLAVVIRKNLDAKNHLNGNA